MSRILMVASEAAPFIKTGGLADVLGALPAALAERGEQVAVVLPWYGEARVEASRCVLDEFSVWAGPARYGVRVHEAVWRGVPYFLVECAELFGRKGIYFDERGDFPDNHLRFAVLNKAALAVARWRFRPDIVHCHDWQGSLAAIYLKSVFAGDPVFLGVKTLLTIHNLGYQGIFPPETLPAMGLDSSVFHIQGVEFYGKVNLLKGGILYSDALTTVSKAYAREIQTPEYGCGLEAVLAARSSVLMGILNGADYSEWSPETDRYLPAHYSRDDLAGKQACKRALLAELGLPEACIDRPLVGIVSRLVSQKGFDLIEEAAPELMKCGICLAVLGTGESRYETLFRTLAAAHPDRVAARIAYDNPLAHRIEGGADIFLMPSRYEPCGLNQIYSLRYGTVPVVRATGGLDDTVDEETGFKFREYSAAAMMEALRKALDAYRNPERWRAMQRAGMARDYSWAASAAQYSACYQRLRLAS
jgi:starch synthase